MVAQGRGRRRVEHPFDTESARARRDLVALGRSNLRGAVQRPDPIHEREARALRRSLLTTRCRARIHAGSGHGHARRVERWMAPQRSCCQRPSARPPTSRPATPDPPPRAANRKPQRTQIRGRRRRGYCMHAPLRATALQQKLTATWRLRAAIGWRACGPGRERGGSAKSSRRYKTRRARRPRYGRDSGRRFSRSALDASPAASQSAAWP